MIQRVSAIIQRACFCPWIGQVIQTRTQTACGVETSRDAAKTDGVQAIGILQDAALDTRRGDPRREAMTLDCACNGVYARWLPPQCFEAYTRFVRGES